MSAELVGWSQAISDIVDQVVRSVIPKKRVYKSPLSLSKKAQSVAIATNWRAVPPVYQTMIKRRALFITALDTSGSIPKNMLERFTKDLISGIITELEVMSIESEFMIIQCDTKITSVSIICGIDDWEESKDKINIKDGMTPDFSAVFDYVDEEGLQPDYLIYFTNARGKFPKEIPSYNVLWAIMDGVEESNFPFGDVVFIPGD